ncbi:SDR family oxidoreductase [Oscillatoria amoena NRMC-F 0135]|nr:SDR family oxidoreductase [Geitlerinema splendidum]MDL5047918.1 SDR family oxidoreductase [Oscillatoria amoena NRMC-F 0135]
MMTTSPVILLTGASSGIGAACALVFAQKISGVRLAIAARSQDKLEALAEKCRSLGAEVLVIPADLGKVEQAEAVAQKTLSHFGQVDVLINNAGYGQMGPLELIPAAQAQRQFEVNVLGPLALIRVLIPAMRDRGGGRIINVSSLGGRVAFPVGGLYSASKHALEGLSDSLRREVSPFNIKVIVVEPGPVTTDFFTASSRVAPEGLLSAKDSLYQPALEVVENIEQKTAALAWSSERVANVIFKAMIERYPRARYVAATAGNLMLLMMTKVLPTWAVDLFWQKFYGIDRVEKAWKQKNKVS